MPFFTSYSRDWYLIFSSYDPVPCMYDSFRILVLMQCGFVDFMPMGCRFTTTL